VFRGKHWGRRLTLHLTLERERPGTVTRDVRDRREKRDVDRLGSPPPRNWESCWSYCARRAQPSSIFSLKGRLDGLPLRAFNEGLVRPRVARAQEST
jgi:hypothetical protein